MIYSLDICIKIEEIIVRGVEKNPIFKYMGSVLPDHMVIKVEKN
jgi:hypothetical protein